MVRRLLLLLSLRLGVLQVVIVAASTAASSGICRRKSYFLNSLAFILDRCLKGIIQFFERTCFRENVFKPNYFVATLRSYRLSASPVVLLSLRRAHHLPFYPFHFASSHFKISPSRSLSSCFLSSGEMDSISLMTFPWTPFYGMIDRQIRKGYRAARNSTVTFYAIQSIRWIFRPGLLAFKSREVAFKPWPR